MVIAVAVAAAVAEFVRSSAGKSGQAKAEAAIKCRDRFDGHREGVPARQLPGGHP